MRYVIGNWKANKNFDEVRAWLQTFFNSYRSRSEVSVILCPPYPFISYLYEKLVSIENVFIGAQAISSIESGSYTGEVTAKSLAGMICYTIIGHSERRIVFKETNDDQIQKTLQAKKYGIEPIYCVRDEKDLIPENIKFVSYEPVYSIGTGQNESLEKILEMKKVLNLSKDTVFLYGGSVNEENLKEYTASDEVNGFIIGGASLDVNQFLRIVNSL
ncbi:triosephosphate isomerase [Candidatus Roizmanbacteria bacterium]|nr:triosephosphate isomerase [Candidatus Roizmanbacteria bacterium]